mgnify:FL=1
MCKDLIHQDATFMAEAIRNGQTNSFELVSLHTKRSQKFNSKLNGIVTFSDNALEEAINADKELKDGSIRGPFHGVPFTIKDVFDSAGVRTTRGSKLFLNRVPKRDSEVVNRLKNAGGILIGKTNLPEFALAAETSGAIFNKGENPWMKGNTCGGSSGGEAICISSGLSPLGVGSDLGGSNRLPSHYCGVIGFKPTHGRIPLTGHWPEMIARYFHAGPIARSVRDIVCSYHILSGYNGLDQYALPVPIKSKSTSDFRGLKIGWFDNEPYDPVDPQIRNAVQKAVEALELNHCTVEKISVPIIDELSPIDATYVLLAGEGVEYLNKYVKGNESQLSEPIKGLLSIERPDLDAFLKASSVCDSYRYWFTDYFAKYDVLICPTAPNLAPEHDSQTIVIEGQEMPASHAAAITCTFGITGSPAISIPFAMSDNGLPIGIQIVANHYNESTLFDVAYYLESFYEDKEVCEKDKRWFMVE